MEKNQELLNEAKNRFQQIMEYTTVRHKFIDEAGEDDQNQDQAPDNGEGMDNMGGVPADNGMPQDPNAMPQDPNAMPMDGGAGMDASQQGPQGFNPQVPQDGGDMAADPQMGDPNAMPMDGGMGMEPEGGLQPDDNVIDISDLTDSQEETQKDVDKLGDKFDKVMKYLGQFEELIKANDEKINDLKVEFEKRNPTQIEKLSMQTAKSYPFNVTPEEYWKEKEATSNYRVDDDENGKEQGQYTITKNDVDGAVDWKSISDTLDDFDIMHQTMKNTTGLGF